MAEVSDQVRKLEERVDELEGLNRDLKQRLNSQEKTIEQVNTRLCYMGVVGKDRGLTVPELLNKVGQRIERQAERIEELTKLDPRGDGGQTAKSVRLEWAEATLDKIAKLIQVEAGEQTTRDYYGEIALRVEAMRDRDRQRPGALGTYVAQVSNFNALAEELGCTSDDHRDILNFLGERLRGRVESFQHYTQERLEMAVKGVFELLLICGIKDTPTEEALLGTLQKFFPVGVEPSPPPSHLARIVALGKLVGVHQRIPTEEQRAYQTPPESVENYLDRCLIAVEVLTRKSEPCKEQIPEKPEMFQVRCKDGGRVYWATSHKHLDRYQVWKGSHWFEAYKDEFVLLAGEPCV